MRRTQGEACMPLKLCYDRVSQGVLGWHMSKHLTLPGTAWARHTCFSWIQRRQTCEMQGAPQTGAVITVRKGQVLPGPILLTCVSSQMECVFSLQQEGTALTSWWTLGDQPQTNPRVPCNTVRNKSTQAADAWGMQSSWHIKHWHLET